MDDTGEWITTYVAPQKELTYRDWLSKRAIGSYVVLSKYYTKPKRKKKPVILYKPTFTGYVFVYLMSTMDMLIASQFDGFLYYLRDSVGNCCLSTKVIDDLVDRQARGFFDISRQGAIPDWLSAGVKVFFQKGHLAGELGSVNRIGANKIFVTVSGRSVTLPVARINEVCLL